MKILLGKSDESLLKTNIFCTFVKSIFSCDSLRPNIKSTSVSNDKNILFVCALAQVSLLLLNPHIQKDLRLLDVVLLSTIKTFKLILSRSWQKYFVCELDQANELRISERLIYSIHVSDRSHVFLDVIGCGFWMDQDIRKFSKNSNLKIIN